VRRGKSGEVSVGGVGKKQEQDCKLEAYSVRRPHARARVARAKRAGSSPVG